MNDDEDQKMDPTSEETETSTADAAEETAENQDEETNGGMMPENVDEPKAEEPGRTL